MVTFGWGARGRVLVGMRMREIRELHAIGQYISHACACQLVRARSRVLHLGVTNNWSDMVLSIWGGVGTGKLTRFTIVCLNV